MPASTVELVDGEGVVGVLDVVAGDSGEVDGAVISVVVLGGGAASVV